MRYSIATVAGALFLISSAAHAEEGPASVYFHEAPAEVSDKIANLCANVGGIVAEQDEHHVLCTKEVSGMRGALTQALIGNSYSTQPEVHARFAILRDGVATRVQPSQWVETQMAFGQVRRVPVTGRKANQSIENQLIQAGGTQLPPDAWPVSAPSQNPAPAADQAPAVKAAQPGQP